MEMTVFARTLLVILGCACAHQVNAARKVAYKLNKSTFGQNAFCNSSSTFEAQTLALLNNNVYVGATNFVLQFSAGDLALASSFQSGPQNDSFSCNGPPQCNKDVCTEPTSCVDNYNKLLLELRTILVACGTTHRTCDLLDLSNVSVALAFNEAQKCNPPQHSLISVRSKAATLVAASYLNAADSSGNQDFVFFGGKDWEKVNNMASIQTYRPPNTNYGYFFNVDSTADYISSGPDVVNVKAWTSADYAFVIRVSHQGFSSQSPRFFQQSVTKVSRLCQSTLIQDRPAPNNPDLNGIRKKTGRRSYVETSITCGSGFGQAVSAKVYQDNLYVLFANSSSGRSAVCSSSIASLNRQLDQTRLNCFQAKADKAQKIKQDGITLQCDTIISASDTDISCGFTSNFAVGDYGISSLVPLNMVKMHEFTLPVSAFTVTSSNNFTVIFVGTTAGELLRYYTPHVGSVSLSERIAIAQTPILDYLTVDSNSRSVYGITKDEVFKVRTENCKAFTNCQTCLASKDPYCGWCVQDSACSIAADCANSSRNDRWIGPQFQSSFCPIVAGFQPMNVSIGASSTELRLVFDGTELNPRADLYTCHFTRQVAGRDQLDITSNLVGFPNQPRCVFQPGSVDSLRPLNGSDHSNVTLSIKYKGKLMASSAQLLTVYDCSLIPNLNNFTMCSSCVKSIWNCSWCPQSSSCAPDVCPGGFSGTNSSAMCTTVVDLVGSGLVLYGVEWSFNLDVTNLPEATGFQCNYQFCGMLRSTRGISNLSGYVSCSAPATMLVCDQRKFKVRVFLTKGSFIVDSPTSYGATVYNCESPVSANGDCGTCLQFREKFVDCLWCNATSKCQTVSSCPAPQTPVTYVRQCPPPTITSVYPLSGPVNGGTKLTIEGSNLGVVPRDIINVTVGGVPCTLNNDEYLASKRVVCLTQTAAPGTGPVTLRTNHSGKAVSFGTNFNYQTVSVSSFSPSQVLNNTKLTITGSGVNAGNGARIVVNGSTVNCNPRSSTILDCVSPNVVQPGNYSILVKVDGFSSYVPGWLQYFAVPGIFRSGPLQSFKSGGRTMTVNLTDARGVHSAALEVAGWAPVPCEIDRANSTLQCRVPAISQVSRQRRAVPGNGYAVDLIINGVHRVPAGTITYQDDPSVTSPPQLPCETSTTAPSSGEPANATAQKPPLDTGTVIITGKGFNAAGSLASNYRVTLNPPGSGSVSIPCAVTFIEDTSIYCRAPSQELTKYKNTKLSITVTTGNWTHTTPQVLYCPAGSMLPLIIAIPVVVVLILVIVLLLVRHRRRTKEQQKERKMILCKLDDLENKTRETARNAYFELQVGYMTNLTENLSDRITYLPATTYFTQTLFNKTAGHPVQDKAALKCESVSTLDALNELMTLLKKKDFVITLITTLEDQRRFTVQDKGSVASLLTVCLLSDLPYYTKIMLELLSQLIEKHVAKNPKLLLRRSESVVEKMVSHWLSITLYDDCITDNAGKPIFLLTKAIHYLVNSAPCDVIANKAMNSLNEMTLLGSEVPHDPVILHASIEESAYENLRSSVDVKVISVDTITQAKTKVIEAVYKDRPYSECPKPDDLEFVYLSPSNPTDGIILSDVDSTSEHDGHYTKINTLKHYNVPNDAIVMLRPPSEEIPDDERDRGSFAQFLERGFSFDVHLPPTSPRSPSVQDSSVFFAASPDSKSPLLTPGRRIYHLIHPRDDDSANGFTETDENQSGGRKTKALIDNLMNRPFQEMYLTRMVRSKTTLQQYVDDVFRAILCPKPLPTPVRYFFQFLDREAEKHRVNEAEVIHIWKTNSLLLRYWVNVLKNPEFLFDTNKTAIVDSCLNVITQAFMDACTTTHRKLGHDSPSNKLLYAKDAETYKVMVKEFFVNVSNTEKLGEEDMNAILRERSKKYGNQLNEQAAAQLLASHLLKYREQVVDGLRDSGKDSYAKAIESICQRLGERSSITTVV